MSSGYYEDYEVIAANSRSERSNWVNRETKELSTQQRLNERRARRHLNEEEQEEQQRQEQQRQERQWQEEQQRQEEERQRQEEEQNKSYMKGKWDEQCNVRDEVESNNLKKHLADLNLATELPTMENLNRGFRRVAMKFHPDKCVEEKKIQCADKFKQLNSSKITLQGACFDSH